MFVVVFLALWGDKDKIDTANNLRRKLLRPCAYAAKCSFLTPSCVSKTWVTVVNFRHSLVLKAGGGMVTNRTVCTR